MVFKPPSGPFTPPGPSGPSGPSFPRPRPFPGRFQNQQPGKDEHRINEQIRVPQVRLIDEKGGQVGVVETREAIRMAREKNLDLMEVAPNVSPPVCKICDYGKFKYEKKKKDHQAKKKQTVIKVKEVQFRPHTEEHDREYKMRNIRQFLEDGDKAKITIMFRGREVAHTEPGYKIMKEIIEKLGELAIVEMPPKMEGRKLMMILTPAPKKPGHHAGPKKEKEKKETVEAKSAVVVTPSS